MGTDLENQGSAMQFMIFRKAFDSRNLAFDLQPTNTRRTQDL